MTVVLVKSPRTHHLRYGLGTNPPRIFTVPDSNPVPDTALNWHTRA